MEKKVATVNSKNIKLSARKQKKVINMQIESVERRELQMEKEKQEYL